MIPSDHFVRFYNEVFKALAALGEADLQSYWRELGRLQSAELADRFRSGGLQACYDYWEAIRREENCDMEIELANDYLELRMNGCPSLSKVLDNDAEPFRRYCDHCMGWVEPVMAAAGLYAVNDMISRQQARCILRVYTDRTKAAAFEKSAALLSKPYAQQVRACCRDPREEGAAHNHDTQADT